MSQKRKFKRVRFSVGMTGDKASALVRRSNWELKSTWWKKEPTHSRASDGVACWLVEHPSFGKKTLTFERETDSLWGQTNPGPYILREIAGEQEESI